MCASWAISTYLYLHSLVGVVIVAVVVHLMATPIRGMGIAVPIFIPPGGNWHCGVAAAALYACVSLYRRQPGHSAWRESVEAWQPPGPWGTRGLHWRSGDLRWHLSPRDSGSAAGLEPGRARPVASIPVSATVSGVIGLANISLQRHFSVLTKFAYVESWLSGRKRQREVVFYAPVNLCDRRACSASVAVGIWSASYNWL